MSLRQFLPTNRNTSKAAWSSLENDRPPTYTSNVTDGVDGLTEMRAPSDTPDVAERSATPSPHYIYYRIYAEDGAIPSKTPAAPDDPFLGRIKAKYVPPPHTVKGVKLSIVKAEDIKNCTSTSLNLFLTPYSQSPMGDADKVTILNRTGPGSKPQEPLALVAKMSDSERSALESGGRGELASAAETDTTHPKIRYLYYELYADNYVMPSKVAIDPEEPSLGRIRADSVAPPHSSTSIKRCISRVERTPVLAYANLYADISCDTPLEEGHISILHTNGPGLSPNEPMVIVQLPIEIPTIPDGKYIIKNRAVDLYWTADYNPIRTVYFWAIAMKHGKTRNGMQWRITNDTNGYISVTSLYAPSSWVGAEMTGSTVPVPWRLIPAPDGKFYYLTTDVNRVSQNTLVPTAQQGAKGPGSMATLRENDQLQMWEFIPIL